MVEYVNEQCCQGCSKALVCKYAGEAEKLRQQVNSLASEEMSELITFSFKCKFYTKQSTTTLR